jgi:hypothetical protein
MIELTAAEADHAGVASVGRGLILLWTALYAKAEVEEDEFRRKVVLVCDETLCERDKTALRAAMISIDWCRKVYEIIENISVTQLKKKKVVIVKRLRSHLVKLQGSHRP